MTRDRLPNRRQHATREFEYGGIRWTLGEGGWRGRTEEVFVSSSKGSTELGAMARDACVLISIALQHGVPAGEMRAAITRLDDGGPASVAGRILDELCGELECK